MYYNYEGYEYIKYIISECKYKYYLHKVTISTTNEQY